MRTYILLIIHALAFATTTRAASNISRKQVAHDELQKVLRCSTRKCLNVEEEGPHLYESIRNKIKLRIVDLAEDADELSDSELSEKDRQWFAVFICALCSNEYLWNRKERVVEDLLKKVDPQALADILANNAQHIEALGETLKGEQSRSTMRHEILLKKVAGIHGAQERVRNMLFIDDDIIIQAKNIVPQWRMNILAIQEQQWRQLIGSLDDHGFPEACKLACFIPLICAALAIMHQQLSEKSF